MAYIVASVAGLGFFALSVSLLGVWPGQVLAEQTALMQPEHPLVPSASEERGRAIYAREGCAYCHSQQIRYTEADIARFGAPTLAWETRFDYPHLMGTRRIGPDLSRASGTRTENWHFVHLYAPRAVVPLSVMPSYASLFDGSPDQPSQEARDLVAYLESLGRARELAWPEGDEAARLAAGDDKWALMSFDAPLLNAHPARTRADGEVPELGEPAATEVGLQLWHDNCAGCHGNDGRGDGPAAAWLSPQPTNLAEREYTRAQLTRVLWNGVDGTSMPAWRDHPSENIAALVEVVLSQSTVSGETGAAAADLQLGEQIYAANCAECHGAAGGGDGYAANDLPIRPTDFRGERPSLGEGIRVLRSGIEGTSMAPWTDRLNDEELVAVAHYIRGFFVADSGSQGADR
jgi:cytochrome c oxidase cbb3-type subunit 2/cytochrome c oxidase cbb3-type subunit I/II